MPDTMAARIAELGQMTTAQLREQWRRVMGSEPRSYNRAWLHNRLAWAIQATEYGGLSARAQARIEELLPYAEMWMPLGKRGLPAQTTSTAIIREIRHVQSAFRQLSSSFARLGPALAKVSESDGTASGKGSRKRPRLSRDQRAALKLQGKYMGTMRGLKPGQRAKVKKIRAEKGIRAAIRAAERMAERLMA